MSTLTEYNEELHLKTVRQEAYQEGRDKYLIKVICKKLFKGKTVETMAEELEEDINDVREIYDAAMGYFVDRVYDAWKAM